MESSDNHHVSAEPLGASERTADETLLAHVAAPASSERPLLRLLLVLAHPDDEVLAMGARLERLRSSRLLTLTDGAPADGADARHHGFATLEAYRAARHRELLAALAHAGVPATAAPVFTGQVPDQQASVHLAVLARALAAEIARFAPDAILTHSYEGGHPDHDACAFAVHAAVRLAAGTSGQATPIVEAPFYHAAENGSMQTGRFLPPHGTPCITQALSPAEQAAKRARLGCFPSQAETLAQFGVAEESFRIAPAYDFLLAPHGGTLFYEQFPWGMQGEHFRSLAAQARKELFGDSDAAVVSA